MNKPVITNQHRASALLLFVAGLSMVNYLYIGIVQHEFLTMEAVPTVAVLLLLSFLIKRGYGWVKWVHLVLSCFILINIVAAQLPVFHITSLVQFSIAAQLLLLVTALLLQFIKPKAELAKAGV